LTCSDAVDDGFSCVVGRVLGENFRNELVLVVASRKCPGGVRNRGRRWCRCSRWRLKGRAARRPGPCGRAAVV